MPATNVPASITVVRQASPIFLSAQLLRRDFLAILLLVNVSMAQAYVEAPRVMSAQLTTYQSSISYLIHNDSDWLLDQLGMQFAGVLPLGTYALDLSYDWDSLRDIYDDDPTFDEIMGPQWDLFVRFWFDSRDDPLYPGESFTLTIDFNSALLAAEYGVTDIRQLNTAFYSGVLGGSNAEHGVETPVELLEVPVFPERIVVPLPGSFGLLLAPMCLLVYLRRPWSRAHRSQSRLLQPQ